MTWLLRRHLCGWHLFYLQFVQVAVTWLHLSLTDWTTSPLIDDSLLVHLSRPCRALVCSTWAWCCGCKGSVSSNGLVVVTISDLAIFNFLCTIRRGLWSVTYVADTCLLTIRPGGSHKTPPVSYWLDHITTHRWLPPSTLLWLSTRSLYVYFASVLPRYISQACWVASSPRLDFFHRTAIVPW